MQPVGLAKDWVGLAHEAYAGLVGVRLSPEARSYCVDNAFDSGLAIALDTARRTFTLIGDPVVELLADPEIPDRSYLVIEIRVRCTVKDNVTAHRKFASEAARLLAPKREIIKLHYDIV